jgi:hypothetical protein
MARSSPSATQTATAGLYRRLGEASRRHDRDDRERDQWDRSRFRTVKRMSDIQKQVQQAIDQSENADYRTRDRRFASAGFHYDKQYA